MTLDFSAPGLLGWLTREASDEDEPWNQGLSYSLQFDVVVSQLVQSLNILSLRERMYTLDAMHIDDPTVSNLHIRIYSIRYDPGVEPFVYAENSSMNGLDWLYQSGTSWYVYRIPKGEAVLLSSGDKLRLCDKTLFTFETRLPASQLLTSTQMHDQEDPDCRQVLEKAAFDNVFTITDRKLGSGFSGRVYMAIDRHLRHGQLACKIVQLKKCHTHDSHKCSNYSKSTAKPLGHRPQTARIWREVDLLKELSHPNIVGIHRVFYTEYNIYIIEEFVTGGDLMSYIERHDWRVDPDECCLIVYQILKAVSYLHQSDISHRDIKPENILMSSTFPGARVILTDFGGAIKVNPDSKQVSNRMLTMTGTRHYVAPEVRGTNSLVEQSGYTSAVDMWSVGCVTAAILIGRSAFATSQTSEGRQDSAAAAVIAAAAKHDLHVLDDIEIWGDIGIRPKDFILRLLVLDEQARLTADQALMHDWFRQQGDGQAMLTRYNQAVDGWRPSWPGWDFKEELDAFIDRRIPSYDPRRYCSCGEPLVSELAFSRGISAGTGRN
ncbi:MAG: hypothetical protein LQ349_002330 [Xanthoria aureola]|nr:MAG: hypothetical protein LQ349_002330 [Xanthoria aureola]